MAEPIDNRMRKALWICLPYFLFWFFLYHIDKFISTLGIPDVVHFIINCFIGLYCIFFPLIMLGCLWEDIEGLLIDYKVFTFDKIAVPIIYIFGVATCCFSPIKLSSEIFESPIVYKGYSRRPTSILRLKLRQNHRFEENNSHLSLSVFSYGAWQQKSDTIFLKRDVNTNQVRDKLSDTLILSGGYLISISDIGNSDVKSLGLKLE